MNLSNIMEKWDGVLYTLYNGFAFAKYVITYPTLHKMLMKNRNLKDCHINKRCIVLANGPSINEHDLSILKKEYVFCTNYFFRSTLPEVVKPNYYCWLDFHEGNIREVPQYVQEIKRECPGVKMIFNKKVKYLLKEDNDIFYTYNKFLPNYYGISCNLGGIFSGFTNITLYTICCAIYMGFKEIYILGLDFEPGAFKHFQKLNKDTDPHEHIDKVHVAGSYWYYTKAHYESYALAEYAKKRGIKLINLNKDSYIRAFDFMEFEDVFNS